MARSYDEKLIEQYRKQIFEQMNQTRGSALGIAIPSGNVRPYGIAAGSSGGGCRAVSVGRDGGLQWHKSVSIQAGNFGLISGGVTSPTVNASSTTAPIPTSITNTAMIVHGFVYGESIPLDAVITIKWQHRNDVMTPIWVELGNQFSGYPLGVTWQKYLANMSTWFGQNHDLRQRWRVALNDLYPITTSAADLPVPKTRWKCGHKYLEVDKECPICKAFGRPSVNE